MVDYRSTYTVRARQLEHDESIVTNRGVQQGYDHQWIIYHPDGKVEVMDDDTFEEQFEEQTSTKKGK